ncbi:integrase catalytic domain-containing protein [Trichonephila clavipes]|nr:integrase catalytic domain-containing protein [Trichonephila clavipes]
MSQLSAKASVFKPINYIGEISKEVSSQGVGDLFTATSYVKSKSVLLSTAICFIRDSFGKMQEVRALLDGGSTSNFISQQCMNRLNLKREKINILVSGLNNSELTIKSRVNATNFVGANIELKKMFNLVCKPDEALASYMASEGIDWKFLPPRAPNFGGLWEAGVKSFKFYLKRVVSNIRLTYEEFLTVIIQIEGMLNSRPLVPLSSDLDDLNVLTPSHFLIGRSITSIVEPDLTNLNENRLDNWQKITKIIQLIWKRWSVDYLNSLQQRNKWHFEKKNAKIGDMVIIKEDNLPSCQWSLGRINNIYPGKDSKVRVVEVKTTRGIFKRPISKLCILPIETVCV